jgi:hypothetical protein
VPTSMPSVYAMVPPRASASTPPWTNLRARPSRVAARNVPYSSTGPYPLGGKAGPLRLGVERLTEPATASGRKGRQRCTRAPGFRAIRPGGAGGWAPPRDLPSANGAPVPPPPTGRGISHATAYEPPRAVARSASGRSAPSFMPAISAEKMIRIRFSVSSSGSEGAAGGCCCCSSFHWGPWSDARRVRAVWTVSVRMSR